MVILSYLEGSAVNVIIELVSVHYHSNMPHYFPIALFTAFDMRVFIEYLYLCGLEIAMLFGVLAKMLLLISCKTP